MTDNKNKGTGRKKRVLVVDDERDFLEIVKLNLEKTEKYDVMTLEEAKDICAQAQDFKPDIILLDNLMPGLDGMETCKILGRDPIWKSIPIIMLSALTGRFEKLYAEKLGAVDYLTKPIDKDTLVSKIEETLRAKEG